VLIGAVIVGAEIGSTQWVALALLLVMGVTIMSPTMDIWGHMPRLKRWQNEAVSFPSCSFRCCRRRGGEQRVSGESAAALLEVQDEFGGQRGTKPAWCMQFMRWTRKRFFQFTHWVRRWSWVLRWIIDLGLPCGVILFSSEDAQSLIGISAWAQAMAGVGVR